jgi:hypothetical protein
MPGNAGGGSQAVTENVGPGADDLSVDALLVEPGAPRSDRLDQTGKERPHLEAVVEMQRRRRAVGFNEPHADLLAAGGDRIDQLRRNVVGMNVDRHAVPLGFMLGECGGDAWRRNQRAGGRRMSATVLRTALTMF